MLLHMHTTIYALRRASHTLLQYGSHSRSRTQSGNHGRHARRDGPSIHGAMPVTGQRRTRSDHDASIRAGTGNAVQRVWPALHGAVRSLRSPEVPQGLRHPQLRGGLPVCRDQQVQGRLLHRKLRLRRRGDKLMLRLLLRQFFLLRLHAVN